MKQYFKGVKTIEELKKRYRDLVKELHPDVSGHDTAEEFKAMQNQYKKCFDKVKNIFTNANGETYERENNEDKHTYQNIIDKLVTMRDVDIDVIGSWVWVSGNTKQYVDELKALKLRYSGNKKAWYYNGDKRYFKRTRHNWSMQDLKNSFNHEHIENEQATLFQMV